MCIVSPAKSFSSRIGLLALGISGYRYHPRNRGNERPDIAVITATQCVLVQKSMAKTQRQLDMQIVDKFNV